MKITLPKTWITDPSCPTPGNPRVADDFRLRGYFLTYDQAEKVLEAILFLKQFANHTPLYRDSIYIMTGERD